jgi:hypothetical protein
MFRCTDSFYYYLDLVVTNTPPAIGTEVHAGDLLGQTHPGANGGLDVGVFDSTVTLTGFVNLARYGFDEIHCVTPWGISWNPTNHSYTPTSTALLVHQSMAGLIRTCGNPCR